MTKPSETIGREREHLIRFRDALNELMESCQSDEASADRFDKVAVAAGEARRAYAANDGRTFPVQDGIYVVPNADPMSHWPSLFAEDSDLTASTIMSSLNLAIGRAGERYDSAKQAEQGFVGFVAAILRWPSSLRDAVGPGKTQRRVAQSLGILGQVLVSAAAAVLGAAIIQGAVLAWGALFGS